MEEKGIPSISGGVISVTHSVRHAGRHVVPAASLITRRTQHDGYCLTTADQWALVARHKEGAVAALMRAALKRPGHDGEAVAVWRVVSYIVERSLKLKKGTQRGAYRKAMAAIIASQRKLPDVVRQSPEERRRLAAERAAVRQENKHADHLIFRQHLAAMLRQERQAKAKLLAGKACLTLEDRRSLVGEACQLAISLHRDRIEQETSGVQILARPPYAPELPLLTVKRNDGKDVCLTPLPSLPLTRRIFGRAAADNQLGLRGRALVADRFFKNLLNSGDTAQRARFRSLPPPDVHSDYGFARYSLLKLDAGLRSIVLPKLTRAIAHVRNFRQRRNLEALTASAERPYRAAVFELVFRHVNVIRARRRNFSLSMLPPDSPHRAFFLGPQADREAWDAWVVGFAEALADAFVAVLIENKFMVDDDERRLLIKTVTGGLNAAHWD